MPLELLTTGFVVLLPTVGAFGGASLLLLAEATTRRAGAESPEDDATTRRGGVELAGALGAASLCESHCALLGDCLSTAQASR